MPLNNPIRPQLNQLWNNYNSSFEPHHSAKKRPWIYIITLKIVAKECNHPKSGFFDAVLRAMQEKSRVPDYIFKQYLRALLGDKDDERVLDSMAKVEKAMRSSSSMNPPFRGRGRGRGRGRIDRSSVICFACGRPGHYQRSCPDSQAPPPKRGRFVGGLDPTKN